jgi:hypothetical protein
MEYASRLRAFSLMPRLTLVETMSKGVWDTAAHCDAERAAGADRADVLDHQHA